MSMDRDLHTAVPQTPDFCRDAVLRATGTYREETNMRRPYKWMIALALIVMLLGTTAFAAGVLLDLLTPKVAEMNATGQLMTWGLEEKYAFVQAMQESGYDMDDADFAILADESQPAAEREAAADRIVYARYGAIQEEMTSTWIEPPESVMGMAPEPVVIFRERFLAENPDADIYDYWDALGYWLRDEYNPAYEAARGPVETPVPERGITKERVESYMLGYLTEVASWDAADAKKAVIEARPDEATGAWYVTANGGEIAFWVALSDSGSLYKGDTLEKVLADVDWSNRQFVLQVYTEKQATEAGLKAIADKYGLSDEEINRYFCHQTDHYTNDPTCIRFGIVLRTRNNSAAPWHYAAIVNITTGQADEVFTADDLFGKLPAFAAAWPDLQENEEWLNYYRWYTTWCPHGDFGLWPLEVQARASELFWEYGQAQKALVGDQSPTGYYALQMFANHRYAMPGEGELGEQEATARAVAAAAKALNVPEEQIASWQVERTFSRDEGEPAMWRFLLTDVGAIDRSKPWHAIVWLDGATGEVLHAADTSPEGETYFPDADVL